MRSRFFCALLLVLTAAPGIARAQDNNLPKPPMIIRKSGGVFQGSAVKRVEPTYPPLAKAARISGSVVVELTLDEEGSVISTRVISGHPLLKDAAVFAAKGWKFNPTLLSGVAVKVIGTLTFNFTLDGGPEDIESLFKAVQENPASSEARHKLGSAYYTADRYEDAIEQLKEATRISPDSVDSHYKLGLSYGALRRYDEAAASFREAARLDPNDADAMVGLGLAESMLYRYDEAISSFKRAIEIEPTVADTYFSLGMTYAAMGRNNDAISTFKNGLAIRPNDVQAHYQLGGAYAATGNKQAAMEEYATLRKLDLNMAESLLKLVGNR